MSLPGLTIRRAQATESARLVELAIEAWDRDLRPYLTGAAANPDNERRRLASVVHDLFDRIIVADIGGFPVGWCARARSRAYVPFLFVAPEMQSRGIGKALLRRMETLFELEGAESVQLDTLSDNVRAVKFYQHQGYQILALRSQAGDHDPQVSIRLEKRLSPWRAPLNDDDS